MDVVVELIAAFVGSLGFSLLFNVDKKDLLPASLGGLLSWAVYLFFEYIGLGLFVSTVFSAAFAKFYSEFLARKLKAPTTVFYISAVIPLVPGGSLYYTMHYAVAKDWDQFKAYGSKTLQVAVGIAVGISLVTGILHYLKNIIDKGKK